MKKRTRLITLLFFPLIIFTACRQEEVCNAFDPTLLNNWFPYQQGISYSFISSDGSREVLVIDEVDFTEKRVVDHGFSPGYTGTCDVHGKLIALTDKNKPDEMGMSLEHSQMFAGATSGYVALEFHNSANILLDAKENDLGGKHERGRNFFSTQVYSSMNANDRTYNDVIEISITNDEEAERAELDKIYISRGEGIIGYSTYPAGKEFWKE